MRKVILFLLLSVSTPILSTSQVMIERSNDVVQKDGKDYYVHTVKKGETIYSICKFYGISESELKEDNPDLNNSIIRIDQRLYIRFKYAVPELQDSSANEENISKSVNYIYHIIKKGETLYSISREYDVTIADIIITNPGVESGLSVNTVIRIPQREDENIALLSQDSTVELENVNMIKHVVKKRETLFSIANMYDVRIEDIKLYNPTLFEDGKDKIKKGKILYIPIMLSGIKRDEDKTTTTFFNVQCDSIAKREEPINISLLLPLDATEYDESQNILPTFHFTEMYEGAIIALNKLRKQGVSVNLSVFDTETTDIETILRSPAINKADLIIGPVYQEDFITVASFAKERGIKIVSPLTPIDSSLYECSNVFQVPTDFNIQSENLLTHPQINAERSNIILISQQGNEESKEMHRLYRQFLPKLDTVFYRNNFTAEKDSTFFMDSLYTIYMEREHNPVVKRISYRIGLQPRDNHVTFLEVFDPRIINRVIVASEDEPFVSEVIANLKAFSDRYKSRVTVYGTNKWRRFENVEISNYYYLKLHLAAPYYVNYDSENVIDFIKEYRGKYKTEPSQFAFQGYDVMYYFTTAMYNYGVEFIPCLQNINVELLQSRYKFSPKQTDGAYENKDCFLLRYNAATMEITPYK